MEENDLSRTVKLTPGFLATAASWELTPEELARRVCESFEREYPPGSEVLFILDGGIGQPSRPDDCALPR